MSWSECAMTFYAAYQVSMMAELFDNVYRCL